LLRRDGDGRGVDEVAKQARLRDAATAAAAAAREDQPDAELAAAAAARASNTAFDADSSAFAARLLREKRALFANMRGPSIYVDGASMPPDEVVSFVKPSKAAAAAAATAAAAPGC
jgi:hypothetical protein